MKKRIAFALLALCHSPVHANNINAKFVLIIGEKEIKSGKAQFKSLHSNIEDFEIELKSDLIAKKFNDFQKINYA